MHWIQRYILTKLAKAESCRYSDLIPEGVDGNLFMYHLKNLINEKYILKEDKKYFLSKQGKSFVATFSIEEGKVTKMPRVFSMLFMEAGNKILFYKWNRQPYIGHVSLPFNRIIYGKSIRESATETLHYKTSLEGEIKFLGTVDVIVKENDKISTHYISHIHSIDYQGGEVKSDGLTGQPFWGKVEDFTGSDCIYGTKEIIEIIKTKKSPFFEELVITK